MMDDLPGIARPAAAVFSSLSAMAAGVIIHRALRPTPARMELHPLRQYWLEPRAINIAPLATSTVLFYATIIIGRSDGTFVEQTDEAGKPLLFVVAELHAGSTVRAWGSINSR